jgi:hypothetical protein
MSILTFKLFAPSIPNLNWEIIIKEFKIRQEQQQLLQLAIEIKSVETWHDSLNYKRGNPYKKVNGIGALGAYQFMPATLRWLGYKGTIKYFLSNPALQTQYMLKLINHNRLVLSKKSYRYGITPTNYIGRTIKGVEITMSGLIAASHLSGAGGVQKFFAIGHNAKDRNGTTTAHYLNKFKGII